MACLVLYVSIVFSIDENGAATNGTAESRIISRTAWAISAESPKLIRTIKSLSPLWKFMPWTTPFSRCFIASMPRWVTLSVGWGR